MDTIFALLACCLVVFSLPAAQMEDQSWTIISPSPGLNLTLATTKSASSNSTAHATVISNSSEHTTSDASTKVDDGKFNTTAATIKSISQHPTSQAATILTTLTNTTLKTTTPSTPTPAFTTLTTHAIHTTSYISTPEISTTENPHYTFSTAIESVHRNTQGVHLNESEKSMTIIFSAVLLLFVVALVIIMFHKCKHKIQYLHQPLYDTNDTGGLIADEDTLVISGGLYDGHPIYDNVPPVPADQSQFRLEFLH